MSSRTGQFRRSMKERFGPAKALKAEHMVTSLKSKYPDDPSRAYAITTATMAGTTKRDRSRK